MEGDLDAVVVGVGSGGTLTGLGRFFAKASPKTKMVLADPVGSILAPLVERGETSSRAPGSWRHRRGLHPRQLRPGAGGQGL
jgi:cystathionine beta-synthase